MLIFPLYIHPNGSAESYTEVDYKTEEPVTVPYIDVKAPFNLTNEDLDKVLFDLKYFKTIGDWKGVADVCNRVYRTDFFDIEDENLKTIYLKILVNKLIAHKERLDLDLKDFKESFRYLEKISQSYAPALEFVKSFKPIYTDLKPTEKSFITSYSNESINAKINIIKELPDGSGFVTAGEDKTIKIWDNEFNIKKQIRIPSNTGSDGIINSLAIHPLKPIIACGGYTGIDWEGNSYIYYINYLTGKMLKRVPVYGGEPTSLNFSKDGEYLVQGNSILGLFSIYSTYDWREIRSYLGSEEDILVGVSIKGIEVLDNSFILLYSNGLIRKYDFYMNLIKERQIENENKSFYMDLNPTGEKLAIAVKGYRTIILDTKDFKTLTYLNGSKNIGIIKWAENGALYGTGEIYKSDDNKRIFGMFYWKNSSVKKYEFIPIGDSDSKIFTPLKNNSVVYINEAMDQGIISNNKAKILRKSERIIFNQNSGDKIIFAKPRGTHLAYKDSAGKLYEFNLTDRIFSPVKKFTAFNPTHKMYENIITIGKDPTINGERFETKSKYDLGYIISGSLLFKEEKVVWSGSRGIFLTDFKGKLLWSIEDLDSICQAVYASYDGRFVIAAFRDGSIKWYDQNNGELLLTLYIDPNREEWILFTPDGYYDTSSVLGADMAAWHINRGAEKTPLTAKLSQFPQKLYRPDIINSVINMKAGSQRKNEIPNLEYTEFKDFLANGISVNPGKYRVEIDSKLKKLDLSFKIKSPTPDITGLMLFHNGRMISVKDLKKSKDARVKSLGDQIYSVNISLPVEGELNTYRIFYKDRAGAYNKERIITLYNRDYENKKLKKRGTQHILLVGVSDYQKSSIRDLKYPKNDVLTLRNYFNNSEKLYPKSKLTALSKEILNRDVTKMDIYSSLTNIENLLKRDDRVIIFLAGNVVKINREYYYLTSNSDPSDSESLKKTAISLSEVKASIENMNKAKDIIFLLDCSYKGSVSSRELAYFMRDCGATIILSSGSHQTPIESIDSYNSVFISSFIKESKDSDRDSMITVKEFMDSLKREMNRMSKNRQSAWIPGHKEYIDRKLFTTTYE